jgi:hypothetical protein
LSLKERGIFIGKVSVPTTKLGPELTNQQTNQNKTIDIKANGKFTTILSKLINDKRR